MNEPLSTYLLTQGVLGVACLGNKRRNLLSRYLRGSVGMTEGDEKYKLGELTADMAAVKRVGVIVGFINSVKAPQCEV